MRCAALLSLLFLLFASISSAQSVPRLPAPAWVTQEPLNTASTALDGEAESGFIDLNYEIQVSLAERAVYCRKSIRILTEAGVQNASEISVDYEPTYQRIVFHRLQITREGKVLDRLKEARFRVIQQEKELDAHLYNGTLTALLMLEDIREGDLIDYSFTTYGFNPIYGDKYAGLFETGYGVPIYRQFYKLLVPQGREVKIGNSLQSLQPAVDKLPGATAYSWQINNSRAVNAEKGTPSWHDPYPMIMMSEFRDWSEVAAWAGRLFPLDIPLSPALTRKIAEIRAAYASPEAQAAAALRFVQDKIRYLGIEIGVNSHKPNHPDKVLAQRFGDCKDKSYLLCVMLRALGMEARPVLINTTFRKTLTTWLPSPKAFDHCTVMLELGGRRYWFDPTISNQRGPLSAIAFPNYQYGLVVDAGTKDLTPIPLQDLARVDAKEIFTVGSFTEPARLEVETIYSGSNADNVRDYFRSNSTGEIMKQYRNFYKGYYEKIAADSISHQDDSTTGRFITREYYTIREFWETDKEKKKASFSPFLINEFLKKPDIEGRKSPLALTYPARYHEEVIINLPEDWKSYSSSDQIEHAAARFSYACKSKGSQVRLTYTYESLKDHVAVEELENYLAHYRKINENASFEISWSGDVRFASSAGDDEGPSLPDSPFPLLYALLAVAFFITIVVRATRR
jgi:transglutaminase-like putative cysteine protease